MSDLRTCPVCGEPIFQGDCTNPDCPNDFGESGYRPPVDRLAIAAAARIVARAHDGDQDCRDILDSHTCEATMTAFPKSTKNVIAHRDDGLCVRCGRGLLALHDTGYLSDGGAHFHHRAAKGMGGRSVDHSPANGILLCAECHGWVHAHPSDARDKGWIVRWEESPETVPCVVATPDGEAAYVLDDDIRFRLYPPHVAPCDDMGCQVHGIAASNARESAYWDSIGGHPAPSVWPQP